MTFYRFSWPREGGHTCSPALSTHDTSMLGWPRTSGDAAYPERMCGIPPPRPPPPGLRLGFPPCFHSVVSEPGQKKAMGGMAPSLWPEISQSSRGRDPVYEETSTVLLVAGTGA